MKKKINFQFMILTLIAILMTVSLSAIVYYELFKKEVMRDLRTYTELMVESDAWKMTTSPGNITTSQENTRVEDLRVTLVAPDGNVVFDSNAEIGNMENHGERPEIAEAFSLGEGSITRKSDTMGMSAFYYAVKMDNGYVMRVAKEARSISSVFISVFPVIAVICVVLFLVCIMLAHLLTKSIIGPIDNLANNLDSSDSIKVYKELVPFVTTIRTQHTDILKNASMRQEFTANVSHELKTPLTSISGYSELIESGMTSGEDTIRFAKEIHKNSNRLLTLINDIIRLSQLDQIVAEDVFEDVNLYDIAANCVDMLALAAEKNNITVELHGSKQIVYANRQMMEELIYNLCDNAIRYNKENGRVDVTVDIDSDEHKFVQVKDTGIGISQEHQKRIFERFYRVDKSRSKSTGGTGLGLAIVKHIVARHENAKLSLESEPGKGTCIRVIFGN